MMRMRRVHQSHSHTCHMRTTDIHTFKHTLFIHSHAQSEENRTYTNIHANTNTYLLYK